MSKDDAIALALDRVKTDGMEYRCIEWAKHYSLDDLSEEMKLLGSFWVVRFDADGDPNMDPGPGFAVFVYERTGSTEIPMQM